MNHSQNPINAMAVGIAQFSAVSVALYSQVTYVDLIFSDAGEIPLRYARFQDGDISFFDYIFMRQIDHFHALIFGLGAIELNLFSGRFVFTKAVSVASAIVTAGILAAIAYRDQRSLNRSAAAALAIAGTLNGVGWTVWAFPFQAVVTSFRLFFVAALALACKAAFEGNRKLTIAAIALGAVAMVAHGTGILLLLLLPAAYALARRYLAALVVFAVLLAVHLPIWLSYPGQLPLTKAIEATLMRGPTIALQAATFLGAGIFTNDGIAAGMVGAAAGVAGIAAIGVTLSRQLDWRGVFYVLLIFSALLAAGTAALLHTAYGNETALISARYAPTASAIYIGLALLAARAFARISPALVLAATIWIGIGAYTAMKADREFVSAMRRVAAEFANEQFDTQALLWVYPNEEGSRRILELMRTRYRAN